MIEFPPIFSFRALLFYAPNTHQIRPARPIIYVIRLGSGGWTKDKFLAHPSLLLNFDMVRSSNYDEVIDSGPSTRTTSTSSNRRPLHNQPQSQSDTEIFTMAEIVNFHHHPLGLVGWIARVVQLISSIIVLGITAWATRDTKTVTVIFTLVIVCFPSVWLQVQSMF